MTADTSATRRLGITVVALVAATWLLHGSLASALVTRGDDLLRSGDVSGALARYARAGAIDASSATANDRLAFYLLVRRGPGDAADALRVANAALASHPSDAALLADRALANERLGRWSAAQRDFCAVAKLSQSPVYAHFAARMSLQLHNRSAAIAALREALRFDPAFAPSRSLLKRLSGSSA